MDEGRRHDHLDDIERDLGLRGPSRTPHAAPVSPAEWRVRAAIERGVWHVYVVVWTAAAAIIGASGAGGSSSGWIVLLLPIAYGMWQLDRAPRPGQLPPTPPRAEPGDWS